MNAAVGTTAQKAVQEQVRGMKVRSSVKKLCEGCKVCGNFLRRPNIKGKPGLVCISRLWDVDRGYDDRAVLDLCLHSFTVGTKKGRKEGKGPRLYHLLFKS
jgi:hypothetical protein